MADSEYLFYGRPNGGHLTHIIEQRPSGRPSEKTLGAPWVGLCGFKPSGKRGRWNRDFINHSDAGLCKKCAAIQKERESK